MKTKNKLIFILALAVSIILWILLFYSILTTEQLIGGQRDEYGCLGPAGYTWNETDQLCVREWTRENCPEERGDYCIQVWEPVCGLPTKKQYSNSCIACLDPEVKQYIEGECS